MLIFLTIFQYFIAAVTDIFDKFLISREKIEPVNYTFYTVVMGVSLLLIWPWVFFHLPLFNILLDLFSGAIFSLSIYVFFCALSSGEVSRVIPFIFGLVPVFDLLISWFTGKNILGLNEVAAMFLLIPGALIISYRQHSGWGKHAALKVLSAFLMSVYYAFWQYAAQTGPVLNNLMWNRIGAALVLLVLLIWPAYRQKVFDAKKIKNKKKIGAMFLFKQFLGGANFVFFSNLIVYGKISVISALQGFRYVFIFLIALALNRSFKHILSEEVNKKIIGQKLTGLGLIFLGTIILFL